MAAPTPRQVYGAGWRKVRLEVLERDEYVCQIRGERCSVAATVVDHIVPWRLGGALYDATNLRAACSSCNRSRAWRKPVRRPSRDW